jgi:hypothetical protein
MQAINIPDPKSSAPGTAQTAPLPAVSGLSPMPVGVPSGSAPMVAAPGVLPPSPIAAASPPLRPVAQTSPAPPVRPVSLVHVDSWDEVTYTCQPGDTFAKISTQFYNGREDYAQALQQYNRNHPRASDAMHQTGVLTPGEKVFIPPIAILEQKHGSLTPKPAAGAPTK